MFRDDSIRIMLEYFGLKLLIRCGIFTKLDIQLTKTRLSEITLLKLFGDLLIEIKKLKLKKLLELVFLLHVHSSSGNLTRLVYYKIKTLIDLL